MIIEPCCYSKQLTELLSEMGKSKPASVSLYNTGEWTLAQVLPWLIGSGRDKVTLARPTLSEHTIAALGNIMEKTVVRDGHNMPAVMRLEIVTQVDERTLGLLREYLGHNADRIRVAHCIHHIHLLYCNRDRPYFPLLLLGEVPERKEHAECCNILSIDPALCEDAVAPIRSLVRVNTIRKKLIEI